MVLRRAMAWELRSTFSWSASRRSILSLRAWREARISPRSVEEPVPAQEDRTPIATNTSQEDRSMPTDDLYPREKNLRNILQNDCVACSLHTARNRISWGYGPVPCKLMLVGEAPAKGDPLRLLWKGSNYTGIPFTNERSGVKLRELMCELGAELNRHAYVTNVVKCYPGYSVTKAGKRKLKALKRCHFDACWAHLSQELEMVQPELVVCVGGYPWNQLNRRIGRDAPKLSSIVMSPPAVVELAGRRFLLIGMFHPARWDSWVSVKTPGEQAYRKHLRETITAVL